MKLYHIVFGAVVVSVVGCTAAQLASFSTTPTFKAGQLFCATVTSAGPLIAAIENAVGVPVIVTGLASDVVAGACAAWNAAAVPVAPPANATPATIPVIAAPTPAAATP